MEFIIHNPSNAPQSTRGAKSSVSISIGAGKFSISKKATELMKLKQSDCIEVLEHPTDKQVWAIRKSKDGFPLNKTEFNKGSAAFSCNAIAVKLMQAFEVPTSWRVRFELREDNGIFNLVGKQVIQPKSSN